MNKSIIMTREVETLQPRTVTTCKFIQYTKNGWSEKKDQVVTEYPVTIKINGQEFATMVCTNEYVEDLVIGFLASEGVISEFDDIEDIWIQDDPGMVHVKCKQVNEFYQKFHSKRYLTSCCGKSRQGFYFFNDVRTVKKMNQAHVSLSFQDCFRLMKEMQEDSITFQTTGGVHNASLCDPNGVVLSRMDIGRHNALDKIYGFCLKNKISLKGKVIAFSGRISSEILLKVAKIGCEMVLSKSAPTELAIQLANELGITTVGFIREDSLNVYTHPHRIVELQGQIDSI